MFLAITVSTLLIGCVAMLFGHLRFLRSLSSYQPDIWLLYKRTAYSSRDYPSRYRKLQTEVYPFITDARIIRVMKLEQTLLRIFAVAALISVGAFAVWRFCL
jgi:hypothetical protein